MRIVTMVLGLTAAVSGVVRAEESVSAPRPTPLTRPEMKRLLEDMKARKPRIPLPELTAEEKEKLDERGRGYEGRLRSLYLPFAPNAFGPGRPANAQAQGAAAGAAGGSAGFGLLGRDQDPKMTLSYPFKTEMFWIVSRTNNCQYCLGHQESKLLAAGLSEDEIAALDGDWSGFTPARKAAFTFARKLTYQPYLLSDADIKGLREHYTDLQILEMILSVSGNNSINRWKEGVGVPQSSGGGNFGRRTEGASKQAPAPAAATAAHSYLTPTADQFQKAITQVAPLVVDQATGTATRKTESHRPALESFAEVNKALDACRHRAPRLPLVSEAEARAVASELLPGQGPVPQWVRLLANFPRDGVRVMTGIRTAEDKGDLSPLLKAQVSWIVARQDRAWYATGLAKQKLEKLGQTPEQIAALDGDWSGFSPKERAMFTVARNLATSPVILTDNEVDAAVKEAGPRDVVQLVHYTTSRALFDRITEAAGLQLED